MYFWDATYILVIIGAVICMIASANVKQTFRRYSNVRNSRGITADEVAGIILRNAGINSVGIERISGELTDHYDPSSDVVRLSDSVYGKTSVAAIGVAAHECGHVIQHHTGYAPIKVRTAIVPVVNIGSKLAWPVIVLGLIIGSVGFLRLGIVLFAFTFVFQLVTLPVEFDASHRALKILESSGMLYGEEVSGARKVLTAAAMTYVTAAVATFLQLLRLILLFGRRSND